LSAVADLKRGLTLEVKQLPESFTGFCRGHRMALDEGAREENFLAHEPLDGANKGRDFVAAIEEKRLTVELAAPAMGRRRQAKKTGSKKKPPSKRRRTFRSS
jgi:hypothetical protein